MLYQMSNVSLSFGDKVILSHIDMEIRGKEKIGIVGPNGTGKTSLLQLIAGELDSDRDDKRQGNAIRCSRKLKIEKMSQNHSKWLEKTVEEILLTGFYENKSEQFRSVEQDFSAERFYYEQKYERLLQSFGFFIKDKEKLLKEFSGGEQTKIMLVKLLLTEADILLLDEPTNHLDGESVEALEEWLKDYSGAVVVVSHDRYFLDTVAEVIYELEDTKLKRYSGNYSAYRIEKRKQLERQQKAYERQQEEIERNEQLIRQFKNKPKKAAFARSRKTLLDRMERIEKPKAQIGHIFTGELKPEYPGPKCMLLMEELQIGYEKDKPLMGNVDLRVRRGQKIGILGPNGTGKSTFLKTLIGDIVPVKGRYQFGEKVTIGYFDQSTAQKESEEKVIEEFRKLFPGMMEKELYGTLASYLFKGTICQQKTSELSGGERARLKLCELMTLCPNFLILDEPTNHMDIPAKETLESAFQAYSGTMLVASHDRYFLDQVADAMLVIEDGKMFYYPFGYSHYLQSKRKMERLLSKGVSLDELPAMLSTQDQALVSALKAVPKAARIESRPLSDEEAYFDWKLRLAGEPLEDTECYVNKMYNAYTTKEQEYQELLLCRYESDSFDCEEVKEQLRQQRVLYENAVDAWTKTCLDWYDIWSEKNLI